MNQCPFQEHASWITTHSGRMFWPLNPKPSHVLLEDIVHALSNSCRFNGHTGVHYSVLQHSCHVADLVGDSMKEKKRASNNVLYTSPLSVPSATLTALFHDAGEAYLPDIASPIKSRFYVTITEPSTGEPTIQRFSDIENRILFVISEALSLPLRFDRFEHFVTKADTQMLAAELTQLMNRDPRECGIETPAAEIEIIPWSPARAVEEFMNRYQSLMMECAGLADAGELETEEQTIEESTVVL